MTTRPRTRAALKVMPFPFESALKLPRANRTLARIHTSGCQLPLEEHDRNQIDEASKPLKWRTAWKGRRLVGCRSSSGADGERARTSAGGCAALRRRSPGKDRCSA